MIEPTSTVPGPPSGLPDAQRAHLLGDLRDELVVHRRLDVHPLDRDARLPGVLHRVVRRHVGGALEVGVGEHDHRVLAAQLERRRDQPPRGRFGDLATGLRGTREHDHVDLLDQRRARARRGRSRPAKTFSGQAALAQPVGHQQRGQRRDLRGLEDHAVARRERRDAVAEGVGQRVVPRADHADQPQRAGSAEISFLPLTSSWLDSHPLVGQVLARRAWPRSRRRCPRSEISASSASSIGLAGLRDDRLR